MTPGPSSGLRQKLNSQHYKVLRAAVGDWKSEIPRAMLDFIFKRATPKQ